VGRAAVSESETESGACLARRDAGKRRRKRKRKRRTRRCERQERKRVCRCCLRSC
jgi:hypothetical protein